MKRSYIFWGLALVLFVVGFSVFLTNAQTANIVGSLQFSPSNVKNGGGFTIKLLGAESIPGNTVTRLFIDTNEGAGFSGFKDFGAWLTVAELKAGINRIMNCSAYSSYSPSGSVNVTGKTLSQKLYVVYGNTSSQSEVVIHTKDCSVPASSSGACSVSPTNATIAQNGTVSFKASSNRPSTGGDLVYVTAKEFSVGTYSDFGVGKTIPVGANSVDFKVYALNNAELGNKTFKVYCSTSCPISGCPSGGSPEVVGSATVSLVVTGTNTGGGSSGGAAGSASCNIPGVSLPANSSFYLPIDMKSPVSGTAYFTGSSGQNVSVSPIHSNIKYSGGLQNGRETPSVIVRTGPNFTSESYSLTCDLPGGKFSTTANATLPVVGNPSGKLKLSQVKYLGDIMFPISECPYNIRGCKNQFYDGGSGPKVLDYMNPPALIGGESVALNPAPAKGTRATPVYFSLADPMNPARVESIAGPSIDTANDAFGDFGAALTAQSVAFSKDGKYKAIVSSQGWLFVSANGGGKVRIGSGFHGNISIIKSGSDYILLSDGSAINITNVRDFENYDTSTVDPLPINISGFGDLAKMTGPKIILGDDSYFMVIPYGSSAGGIVAPKMRVFSLVSDVPVVEFDISADSLQNGRYSALYSGKISFSGGDYIYAMRPIAGPTTVRPWVIDIFKFEYSSKKITQVVKGAQLPTEIITGVAGFDIGSGNLGIITFGHIQKSTNYTVNPYGDPEGRIRAYLISDLSAGRVVDTLTNSPVTLPTATGPLGSGVAGPVESHASSYSKDGATYVYTTNSFGINTKVWKFESASASSGTFPPVTTSTPPITGGGTTPTYDCNFDLTFSPASLTVREGTYYANYTIKANSTSVNPFCTINIIPPSQNNIKSDYISTLVVSPNGQASMLLNVSKAARGTYTLPVRAAAKGVTVKNYTVQLTIQ